MRLFRRPGAAAPDQVRRGLPAGRGAGRAEGRGPDRDGDREFARAAHRAFGRGRHPAGLNLDDGLAHAPAQERGGPLPSKGDDRARTDAKRAS